MANNHCNTFATKHSWAPKQKALLLFEGQHQSPVDESGHTQSNPVQDARPVEGHPPKPEKVGIQLVEIALARAGIQIVTTTRINGCGTNVYLEGGGIFCLYDSGRLLLQGKPSLAETALFESLVRPRPKAPAAPKHELEDWEEWLAAHYSEGQP